ncbi:uncharacterized protein LOC121306263 [Polyodon spathula]|uniref:uncharacterized protein LOC121306263 n=1 Tax=Polyodon spathula TaxID=7913 RepID=UPI001B7E3154|nr:uncharacterized protein LOC121306263 [Polyodon spathula]
MGNTVTIKNETNYCWSYCWSFKGTSPYLKGSGILYPFDKKDYKQEAFHSYIYIKYGCHDKEICYRSKDLLYEYYAARNPTFTIRESSDRSYILLACTTESYVPSCPNYGRQNDLRLQQQKEECRREEQRRREEQEERRRLERLERERREEQRRREEQEERRRLERLERERRIQEEIERENKASERQLANVSEKLKLKQEFKGQERHHQRSHILQQLVEDDAAAIDTDELGDIEKKFNTLLVKYDIKEDQSLQSSHIEDRMKTLQNELTAQYCRERQLSIWSQFAFDSAVRYEHLSLTEKFCILEAVVQLTVEGTSHVLTKLQDQPNSDEKYGFLFSLLVQVYQRNATLAGNLVMSVLDMFSELASESKELLVQIMFSKVWTPLEIVVFIRLTVHIPQDQMASVLHKTQTYRLDLLTVISAMKEEDPVKFLQMCTANEKDKDLTTILNEMRANNYPEKNISIIEEVLSKVMEALPKYKHFDLNEEMKNDGIRMAKLLDFSNPDPETLTQVLIGLSIAVQDSTTIQKDGNKIEGYFPRVTQLASLLMLLLSSQDNGCLLEIGTGEGKSSILAMFATIQAIRGTRVDVVTSSPVLARRDQEEWKKLYEMFDVTSSVVPPKVLNDSNDFRKQDELITAAYTKQIVYGTVGNFAADALKQEFEKTQTRGEREFELVIVDEVDYMTLDNGVQVTFLSHEASGLRHAEQILAHIWSMIYTYQPIEMAETGEIQWATKIQHFHKAAAMTVMGSETSEHFKSLDILQPGLQLGFFTQEDIDKVQAAEMEAQKENASEKSKEQNFKVLQIIMDKIDVCEQHDLLRVFEEALDKTVSFKCYSAVKNKAVPFGEHNSHSGEHSIKMLHLPGGCACQIVSQEEIIKATVSELRSRIKYSDSNIPLLQDSKSEPFIVIPYFLKDYIENRLPVYVENGLRAICMTQNREYMIDFVSEDATLAQDSEKHHYHAIIPVDFKASGVLEKNKRWGDGLQQFLEMKHQLAITPLSNVTNYLSNFHYFQRYLNHKGIFGVSGTLGGEADIAFLRNQYKTESYIVPAHRHKKVVELPVVQVRGGKSQWIETICDCVQKVTERGQVALVICEDMKTAEELKQRMTASKFFPVPEMYTISEKHNIEKVKFSSGSIIIATNLGGRGTDIKVDSKVNECGGLCVILTHFPNSRRVEKQVFGRTARKGSPGMVQMVLNYENLAQAYQGQPIEIMRQLREEYEVNRIKDMVSDELLEIKTREELFACFCTFLNSFEKNYTEEERLYPAATNKIPSIYETYRNQFDYHPALNALKECWALWLTLHEKQIDEHVNVNELKLELSQMLERSMGKLLQGQSDNFYDHIKQAVKRMDLHAKNKKNDYGAITYWQEAINGDQVYRAVSKYNQAFITINMGKDGYMKEAIELLNDLEKDVDVHILEATNTMVACRMSCSANFTTHHPEGTSFQAQMETRLSVFNSWKLNINNAKTKLIELEIKKEEAITEVAAVYTLLDEKDHIVTTELMALYEYGLGIVFEVKKKPKFCINALICALLGACQVFLGALVCALSFGTASQIGLGLISGGVSDMIEGIQGIINGTFDWADWAISKSISLGMSLATAGFSFIKKTVTSIYKATKCLLTGTKTLSSAVDDIIRTGKNAATFLKGTAKTTASSLSKDAMNKSWKNLMSSKTLTTSFKEAGKYAVQEIAKETVTTGLNYAVDEGLKAAFNDILKKSFTDIITGSIQDNADLDQYLTKVIVIHGVPKAALQKEDPDTFKIHENIKKMLTGILVDSCNSNVSNLLDSHAVLDQVIKLISKVHDHAKELMQKAKVPGTVPGVIKLSLKVIEYTSDFVQMFQSLPTKSIIDNNFVPGFIKDTEQCLQKIEKNAGYKKDGRHSFREVEKLKLEFCQMISETLLSAFLETFTGHLTSTVTRTFRKDLNKAAGDAVSNLLGRNTTHRFFSDQSHIQDMKKSIKGPAKSLTDAERKEITEYVKKINDVNHPATTVDLLALTKSDLIDGKGIKLIVVDEQGKQISDVKFAGKNSSAGDITLRLTKNRDTLESDKGSLAKIKDRMYGREDPFTGHFGIIQPDGTITALKSEKQNCLYHAVIQAKGNSQEDQIKHEAIKLRNQVRDEVLENLKSYTGIVKLQQGYDRIYKDARKYTIVGGIKRKEKWENDYEEEDIKELQKRVKTKDSNITESNLVLEYKLGTIGKYERMRGLNVNEGYSGHVTKADHIPPKAVLRNAFNKVKKNHQANEELRKKNPKLHTMLMGTDTDPQGKELLCLNTLYQDHRAALTTGNSKLSIHCRDHLTQTLLSGDAEKLLKMSFIVAHPFSSLRLKQDAGLNPREIEERMINFPEEATKSYYLIGFRKLVKQYCEDELINQNQKDGMLSWVEKESYLDVNTAEYKEILASFKQ